MLTNDNISHKLVVLRHGECEGNASNLFTGWQDSKLTVKGCTEAHAAGIALMERGYSFDVCFASNLNRAIETASLILSDMNLRNLQIRKSYKLNVRHRGCLQGLSREEAAILYGKTNIIRWENDYYDAAPPAENNKMMDIYSNPLYTNEKIDELPLTESHSDVYQRIVDFYMNSIFPEIANNKRVLVVTHGQTIAELLRYFIGDVPYKFHQKRIPNASPIVIEFDKFYNFVEAKYLLKE